MADEYIMALDVGDKRIGVALAHRVARLPQPLTTLQNSDEAIEDIATLVLSEQVGLVVVGLPRGMDGGYTAQTRSAEAFKDKLAKRLTVPVHLGDETLTSVQAEATLQGKPHDKADVDALAASYILESFLQDHAAELSV